MAPGKLPYRELRQLLADNLSTGEDPSAAALSRRLQAARDRGYLTKKELEAVCRWKSARAIRHIQSNTASEVRNATRRALATRSERQRLEALCALRGVSVPMASAVLTLLAPRRYEVIDIRVWQLLHRLGSVTKVPSGVGFSFSNWYQFLMILRHYAKLHKVGARDVERTLFLFHKTVQRGPLYRTARVRAV